MNEVKKAINDAGVIVTGHFVFADGDHATTKLEMDNLWNHPEQLKIVLDNLAWANGLPPADVIVGVPTGGQRLALEIAASARMNIPVALLERIPGGAKQDFRFVSKKDEALAIAAKSVRIYEDVVTTLSSVAGVVKLFDPSRQTIHSLAIWRRGNVKEKYRHGVTDHYLIEEEILSYPATNCPFPGCRK